MIYLASPYSAPAQPGLEVWRFNETARFVAHHFRLGVPLFSPIVYCHAVARQNRLPGHADFWKFLNDEMLSRASEMWILMLPGWKESKGITYELEYAINAGIEIRYKEPLPL
jgi:hypothetical protein